MELINLNANFAKWYPCKRAFFGFDSIDAKHRFDDLIRLTWIGDIIELQTSPTTINSEFFADFPAMIISQLNSKANKDMNGNMDPLQMMGKPSFILSKKL